MPRSGIKLTTSRLRSFIVAKVSHAFTHSAMEAVTGPSTVSPVHLRSICSLATVWIQFGYSLAILWLHSGYSLATVRLHSSYLLATVWLHAGYSLAILWLHSGYSSATVRLRAGYILAIVRLHFSYILATVWLHAGYSLGTLWLHSGYSLATALQPRSGCWRRRRGSVGRCPAAIRCQLGHGVRAAVLISSPDNQQRCSFDISPSGRLDAFRPLWLRAVDDAQRKEVETVS